MKYINAEKLKEILKSQIKERKKWMKDPAKSDRQDQLWSDLNGEDMSILQIIDSLQQEQPEVDLEKELNRYLRGEFQQTAGGNFNNYIQVARHFYELGLKATKEE